MKLASKKKTQSFSSGKTVVASMNRKAYGEEPKFDHPIGWKEASHAFTWYSLNCDRKQARSFVIDYLKKVGREDDLAKVKKASDSRVRGYVSSGCWIARMLFNGVEFDDEETWKKDFETGLQALFSKIDTEEVEEDEEGNVTVSSKKVVTKMKRPTVPGVRSPAEQSFDRYLEILNGVADAVDILGVGKFNPNFDPIPSIRDESVDPEYVKSLIAEIKDMKSDIDVALDDPIESVRFKSKASSFRKKRTYLSTLLSNLEAYTDSYNRKNPKNPSEEVSPEPKVRKPRRKKPISLDKIVSKVLYQKDCTELGLSSMDPKKMIGSSELWVYNTKYSILTVYRSAMDGGLSVRGTTLTNFDETKSVSKKVGRKAKEKTSEVLSSGKVQLRRMMDTINSVATKPNGRINENTIILRTG